MATRSSDLDRFGSPERSGRSDVEQATWVEAAARAGYTAKGLVYAFMGFLAVRAAAGLGGEAGGSREALQEIAGGPMGRVLVGLLAGGLVGYVIWRLVQAFADPEGSPDEEGFKRLAMRVFYVGSAAIYGLVAYTAVELVLDASVGLGGSPGGPAAAAPTGREEAAWLMSTAWGVWLLGAIGIGMVARGSYQFFKAYTASFADKIRSFELGPARSHWVLSVSRIGLTARGIIFWIIGGLLIHGSFTRDPSEAEGVKGALEFLQGEPWLLGAIGLGLMGYGIYQWVKARYRLIGVGR